MQTALNGKTYVLTGFSSGIGFACTEVLAEAGADLIGVGRSEERCKQAEEKLRSRFPDSKIQWVLADLTSQAEVRRAAAEIGAILTGNGKNGLDGLINVAGTFEYWMRLTQEGIETQWAVNHLAPFLLSHELMLWLQAAKNARVLTVSSDSHYFGCIDWKDPQQTRHYNGLSAYGATKLANVLFSAEFNRRLRKTSGVRAFAVDPGLVKTEIGFKNTPPFWRWVWQVRRSGGTSPEVPALGIYQLLAAPEGELAEGVYWKDGRLKDESRRALSLLDAKLLWEYSNRLCGIENGDWK
jgi:NAD(P)-dependent dehydrogenase (short-subunit alcohol dehydrogenase family)